MCRVAVAQAPIEPEHLDWRLNQIQTIGTHNSYHIAPEPALMAMIRLAGRGLADSIDYTHPHLTQQFEMGIRQIELDVYADPEGGLFAQPLGYQMLLDANKVPEYRPNRAGKLDRPGLKVIHEPNFDYATRNETFLDALQEVERWSRAHPDHLPILILVELKEKAAVASPLTLVPFDKQQLAQVDAEIRQVFSPERILLPDDLRQDNDSLRQAIQERGWPRLRECQGQVLFALDNEGTVRDLYLDGHPVLQDRVMFVSVPPDHPAAAFRKLNDPVGGFETIQQSVRQGLLVRTRADANTTQARRNDPTQRERAMASGAQFISTDYPVPDPRFSDYQVRFPEGRVYRANPVQRP